jgi:hypothetical protein
MRDCKQLHIDAGIDVFFCDPHAPWKRGSNENTNGLLRQYFPNAFDFSTVTETELDAVADELNERPRKRFGFATPTEQLTDRSNPPLRLRDWALKRATSGRAEDGRSGPRLGAASTRENVLERPAHVIGFSACRSQRWSSSRPRRSRGRRKRRNPACSSESSRATRQPGC